MEFLGKVGVEIQHSDFKTSLTSRQFSEFYRGRIGGLRKAELFFQEIAERVHRSQATVAGCSHVGFRKANTNS